MCEANNLNHQSVFIPFIKTYKGLSSLPQRRWCRVKLHLDSRGNDILNASDVSEYYPNYKTSIKSEENLKSSGAVVVGNDILHASDVSEYYPINLKNTRSKNS